MWILGWPQSSFGPSLLTAGYGRGFSARCQTCCESIYGPSADATSIHCGSSMAKRAWRGRGAVVRPKAAGSGLFAPKAAQGTLGALWSGPLRHVAFRFDPPAEGSNWRQGASLDLLVPDALARGPAEKLPTGCPQASEKPTVSRKNSSRPLTLNQRVLGSSPRRGTRYVAPPRVRGWLRRTSQGARLVPSHFPGCEAGSVALPRERGWFRRTAQGARALPADLAAIPSGVGRASPHLLSVAGRSAAGSPSSRHLRLSCPRRIAFGQSGR